MRSLNQFADNILLDVKQPFNYVLRESIKDDIKQLRAEFLRQDYSSNAGMNDISYRQRFSLKLIDVESNECGAPIELCLRRTDVKVPFPVRRKTTEPFFYIGSRAGDTFTYINIVDLPYIHLQSFSENINPYFIFNNYVYILKKDRLKFLTFEDIFENPDEVLTVCVDSDKCFTDDDEDFPLTLDMFSRIKRTILVEKLQTIPKNDLEVKVDTEHDN